jgi:hypothetical protein
MGRLGALSILTVALIAGCGGSDETSGEDGPLIDVPPGAVRDLDQPADVKSMECSADEKFIDEVLGHYPSVDFVARPTNACTVAFHDGGTLDVLQIKGEWHIAPERLRAE